MREDDGGARYLSSLVKQDLAKLATDGESRRLAVESLKRFVEQLDATTLPRFISQIAESREAGGTRSYAILLYEDVARVHGQLVVPHIAKVMAAVVRSSSASGTFPQLQVANARVTASIARYGIDSTATQEEAEEIMGEICAPLVDALAGKLEPVAANAAACIHALAETEKWKYVNEGIVHEVCQRTTVALSEKTTRTAAHMQLIRTLASVDPDVLSPHGATLLRAGEEILKVTANSWQLRKAAAQMLQSVLTILDKETLETELNSALHALDSCRLDKMPHVRAAVSDALHTAKMLASGTGGGHTSFGTAASPIRKTPTDRAPVSPASTKRGASPRTPVRPATSSFSPTSRESRRLSFSPTLTSASERSVQSPSHAKNRNHGSRARRAPLYPARAPGMGYVHSPRSSGTSPSSSSTTVEDCESPSRRLNVKEFDVRPQRAEVIGRGYASEDAAGRGDSYVRPLAPLSSEAYTPVLPTQLDILGVEIQKMQGAELAKDVGVTQPHSKPATHDCSPPKEDSGLAQLLAGYDDARQVLRPNSATDHVEVVLPRLKLGLHSGPLERARDERTPMPKLASELRSQTVGPTNDSSQVARSDSENQEPGSNDDENDTADVEVEKREVFTSRSESPRDAQTPKFSQKHRYNVVSLGLDEKPVSVGKEIQFPPLVAPTRLVRSLSSLSLPESRASSGCDQETELSQGDSLLPGTVSTTTDGGDFDAETSSEAGWSVRDNPIASEESYRSESSEEETEARRGRGAYTFSSYPKPALKVGSASPRDIRMISPGAKLARAFDDVGAALENDEGHHPCPSCGAVEQATFTSCRVRSASCEAANVKSVQSPGGLCTLLHRDEAKRESSTLDCPTCAHHLSKSKSGNGVEAKHESASASPAARVERRGEHGLMRFVSLNWKKIWLFTEAVLGGSLCLVIALPLALVIAKALNGSAGECHLVPT